MITKVEKESYSVCLFLEDTQGDTARQRLQQFIIYARSREEALGAVIMNRSREYKGFPILYHSTLKTKEPTMMPPPYPVLGKLLEDKEES